MRIWDRRFKPQEDALGVPSWPGEVSEVPPEVVLQQVAGQEGRELPGAMKVPALERMTQRIGEKEISQAIETLTRYKKGKANLEARIVEEEEWWKLRHWDVIRREKQKGASPEPASAWLFNAIINKHADAMDNVPEPIVLPREASDQASADTLSEVLPVILGYNKFDATFSAAWWEKIKHGAPVYGIFWEPKKDNGLGDIDIQEIDLLRIFWEPGISNIQDSRNLFVVDLVDEDLLDQQYPQHKGKMGGSVVDVKQYNYDDTVDVSHKSLVVDWYYKVETPEGRTLLHYVKFVGQTVLFASENDPRYRDRGFYDHGQYPFVVDPLFPEKGTPVGFGYVAICKSPQLYIDKLFDHILDHAMKATKHRSFISENTAVNEEEYLDWNKPLVHVAGDLDDRRIKDIVLQPMSGIYMSVLQMKIDELKETAANQDVNSGSAGGVTAAAAIAALQEAGNKVSRDMISSSYRAYVEIINLCIELVRQFYDEERSFRITGEGGKYRFVGLSNAGLKDQLLPAVYEGQEVELYRRPVFDIEVKAQKKSPFSRMEQNERAMELYKAGFFNPQRAQEAMGALEMMDFEGIENVKDYVKRGQTLLTMLQQVNQRMDQMALIIQELSGQDMGVGEAAVPQQEVQKAPESSGSQVGRTMKAAGKANMTSYGQRLAQRSAPSMDAVSSGATPGM